jgi:hypothetical protein
MTEWVQVKGIIRPGHQVASGQSPQSPYPQGTIALQTPFFQSLGLDLTAFFAGTLNVEISPYSYQILAPEYTFLAVDWSACHPPENFSFSPCYLNHQGDRYRSLVYYPHPETKRSHFQNPNLLEILSPFITDLTYGQEVTLELNSQVICLQLLT